MEDSEFYNKVVAFAQSEHFPTMLEMFNRLLPTPDTLVGETSFDTNMRAACMKYKCQLYDDMVKITNLALNPDGK